MDDRRAVVFDMDGVLVLSGPAHWIAWRDAARRHGIDLSHDRFTSLHGLTNADICARLWGARATPEFVALVADQKERAFRRAIEADVPLAPGCAALLASLQARHVGIGLGSSAPPENVDLVLDRGGIRDFFGAIVSAEMVRRGKPAPDIFQLAAELLGVPPAQCVVVEDAPSGVQAAVAAGMDVVGVATTHTARALLGEGARMVATGLEALRLADLIRP